jgi:hypothetical protein
MRLSLVKDKCIECGDSSYAHCKFPERMVKYRNRFDNQNFLIDIDLNELVYPSNSINKRTKKICQKFVPDNLKYLEGLYEQRRKL